MHHFPGDHTIAGDSTGLHLIAQFSEIEFSNEVAGMLKQNGVRVYPVETHAIVKGRHKNKIIMGYGHLAGKDIAEGVRRLRKNIGKQN